MTTTTTIKMNDWDKEIEAYRKELRNYLDCVKGERTRLFALTDIQRGSTVKLDDETALGAVFDFIHLLLGGGMKINGEKNNWSVGDMGSRWADIDYTKRGLHARVSFFSKKSHPDYITGKPYILRITFI